MQTPIFISWGPRGQNKLGDGILTDQGHRGYFVGRRSAESVFVEWLRLGRYSDVARGSRVGMVIPVPIIVSCSIGSTAGLMLTEGQRRFLDAHRVARLATADHAGRPHVVPICYALGGDSVYFTIDEKPKRDPGGTLKRISNIRKNPFVALVVDRYDEDWSRLGWVMVQGRAEVLESGEEHDGAQARLRARYHQLQEMRIERLPVIAIRIERALGWGHLGEA